jgi:hypothetical protein
MSFVALAEGLDAFFTKVCCYWWEEAPIRHFILWKNTFVWMGVYIWVKSRKVWIALAAGLCDQAEIYVG